MEAKTLGRVEVYETLCQSAAFSPRSCPPGHLAAAAPPSSLSPVCYFMVPYFRAFCSLPCLRFLDLLFWHFFVLFFHSSFCLPMHQSQSPHLPPLAAKDFGCGGSATSAFLASSSSTSDTSQGRLSLMPTCKHVSLLLRGFCRFLPCSITLPSLKR